MTARNATTDLYKPDYDGERPKTTLTGPERRELLFAGNLGLLIALEANGLERCAGALVEKIADGLKRQPLALVPEPVTPIALPDTERGRSAHDIARLDRINARLAKGYKPRRGKTVEEQREDDLREREALENAISLRAEEQLRVLRAAETAALAEARGEEVSTERSGVKRILDRDPLLSLARTGKLTPEQLETGQEVRDLYDRRAEDAGAMEFTGMPGGGHDHERFIGNRFLRAKACEMIGRIERAIPVVCRKEPEALNMLRWVCELGHTVTARGKGRAFDRNVVALGLALDVAEDVLRRRI